MSKDLVELLTRVFSPQGALAAVIILGIFTVLYTAVIKFFFGRRLTELQSKLNADLKMLEAELSRETQSKLQKSEAILTEEQARACSQLG